MAETSINTPVHSLSARLDDVRARIARAAERSGRAAADIRLVAVTKTVPPSVINNAISLGLLELGESRVQEALPKRDEVLSMRSGAGPGSPAAPLLWHFLGHLQTNKVRKAVPAFDVIQSVDSHHVALAMDRMAAEIGKKQACLIEIKISNEAAKHGVPLADAANFIRAFEQYPHLRLDGLMTIGSLNTTIDETRQAFRAFAQFARVHRAYFNENPVLSMGMSDDFEVAIEEGSTMVRLGRVLFGERQ